jgi:hypothetical protein
MVGGGPGGTIRRPTYEFTRRVQRVVSVWEMDGLGGRLHPRSPWSGDGATTFAERANRSSRAA